MDFVYFKPSQYSYKEAKRYASNGLLHVHPDDLLYLLEMAEEFGMELTKDDGELEL